MSAEQGQGRLYVVSTPIGNLGDMTRRAAQVLAEADLIAAEDTRRTLALLNSLGVKNTLISYHKHSPAARTEELLSRMRAGAQIALTTDAGTPVISDPGAGLVERAAQEGIEICPVPGACAAIAALTVCALPADKFVFEGFLPKDKGRARAIERILKNEYTSILYESPHQLSKTLAALAGYAPERRVAVCKELTKLHESVFRGTLAAAAQAFAGENRGEYVLVVEGAGAEEQAAATDEQVICTLKKLLAQGRSKKDAIEQTAMQLTVAKNRVYKLAIQLREK